MHNAAPSDRNAARTTRPIAPASRRAARRRCSACSKTCRVSHRAARQRCVLSKPRRRPKRSRLRLRRPSPLRLPQQPSRPPRPRLRHAASNPLPAPKAVAYPAAKPSNAQVSAIRSACRNDYQQNCAGVPTGGAAALNCLQKNKANLSANCQKAVSAAGGAAAPAGDDAAAAAPAAAGAPADATTAVPRAAPALVLRSMRPREVLFVLRSACGADVRALCAGRSTRRWPCHTMSGRAGRLPFTGMRGRSEPVRRAIK